MAETRRTMTTLAAMRWMVYGPDPLEERTASNAAKRYGLDEAVFTKSCLDDGVFDYQLRQAGWVPANDALSLAARGLANPAQPPGPPMKGMGSIEKAEKEREAREGQVDALRAQRDAVMGELTHCRPDDRAGLINQLAKLNGMLAEVTGLALLQAVALGHAKRLQASASVTKPDPSPPDTRGQGMLIDVGGS